ncbi:DNA-protecting protein DprA [Candidatus Peregrinibacteria bacterium CG_4_10_14_0_2_um_filter_43_11]|nr:MAG: DNA-protecting protein DprA [Candidatus Peregrinibacteria bacterium CG_4_10_14_0_2_um_filter_43_11]
MNDEILYLWAQWGILNYDYYQIVLRYFGDLETAWRKITPSFLHEMGFKKEKAERMFKVRDYLDFATFRDGVDESGVRVFCVDDDYYPAPLKSIPNPPVFLFVRGVIPPLHKALGVVGTRLITSYGKYCVEVLTHDLVYNGFVIVSGLAMGIDAMAHCVTLKNRGVTVAVLGSGIDTVFPAAHSKMAEQIVEKGGAVISEYPLGTPPLAHHFPLRNRIISGLSRGVLVIEGGVKSGALITARYALEQGRDVFAVPHAITRHTLSGTNHIIRRGEAKLVESVQDILEEYEMQPAQQKSLFDFSDSEKEILALLADDGKSIDELASETPYNVARLSEVLIRLQFKRVVREIGQKWVLI